MPQYKYTARDTATGKIVNSVMQAASERAVAKSVQEKGFAILEVKALGDDNFFDSVFGKVKSKQKVIFSRQLSTLIDAGLPLVQSLRSVLDQTSHKRMQSVLAEVISDVESGKSFSASLAKHPREFDQIFVSLVAAGEASGTLDKALERIANQQEKDAELASKVRGAMIYPIIVLIVMIAVVTFMMVSVLPQVTELYDGMPGARLPFVTVMLIAVSDFVIKFWWLMVAFVLGVVIMTSRWARSAGGKKIVDKVKLKSWPVGPLFQKMYMARFSRTGTTLISSGVPIIQVLEITANSISNYHVEMSLHHAIEKVRGGKSLSSSLEGDPNFIDLVPKMLKIGEDSGAIEQMMEKTADYFEKEVDNQIKAISTVIEPVLMVTLGIIAIIIVSAILLPIYSLVGQNVI